jgi:hypothetical protein
MSFAGARAQESTIIVDIDGDEWQLTRHATQCTERVPSAIAQYQKEPIYHVTRAVVGDRYLVNETMECWIELSIAGIHDVSLIYKVAQDQVVLDQRLLSWWGPKVYPYPSEPNGR